MNTTKKTTMAKALYQMTAAERREALARLHRPATAVEWQETARRISLYEMTRDACTIR